MIKETLTTHLPVGVSHHLGWYVYIYVDPRNGKPFYIGKGKGERILAHFGDPRDSRKTRIIKELKANHLKPRLEILAHGLRDAETALRVEAAALDLLGLSELTNEVRGWKSLQQGRMTLDELAGYYAAKPVKIKHPVILIRVNRLYRHNMPAPELLEITRGVWKLGSRRHGAQYAFAVFEGVVREVYAIHEWRKANPRDYKIRQDVTTDAAKGRWQFEGRTATKQIRNCYNGRSVKKYLTLGSQNPIVYVNC